MTVGERSLYNSCIRCVQYFQTEHRMGEICQVLGALAVPRARVLYLLVTGYLRLEEVEVVRIGDKVWSEQWRWQWYRQLWNRCKD